jgi:magnesium-transporting ATPase (P-type)
MGITGTDVARESADMVLLDDNFASIVAAIEEGRAVYDNIRKFLVYIFTSNIPEIVPYLVFALFRIPLPLTVIQILAIDLGTDMLPALGLGIEPPAESVMRRGPRPRRERLLSWTLLVRAYLFLGAFEALAAMSAFFFVLYHGGWHSGQPLLPGSPLYLQATTATLSAIVVMQVANVFLSRHSTQSVFCQNPLRNRLILAGVALEMVLIALIDYTHWGQSLFGTAPVAPATWLFMLPFVGLIVVADELWKAYERRRTVCRFEASLESGG